MKKILLALVALVMATTMSAQVYLDENFNNGIPTSWTVIEDSYNLDPNFVQVNGDWGKGWIAVQVSQTNIVAGSASAIVGGDKCDRWLITPKVSIDSSDVDLFFTLVAPARRENLNVMVSNTLEKDSFKVVKKYKNFIGEVEARIDLDAYHGQEIYIAFVNCSKGLGIFLDDVKIMVPIQLNMELVDASIPPYTAQNKDVTVRGTIKNKGVQNINSFDAYFVFNGESSAVTHISNIDVAYSELYDFAIEAPFNCSELGNKTIQVYVTNINGDSTVELQNNVMMAQTEMYDASYTYPRTVLMEHFTTGQCPNCPRGDATLSEAVQGRDDVIWLSHHAGFYEDDMTIQENTLLLTFFNNGGRTYAPGVMFDRTHMNAAEPGPVMGVDGVDYVKFFLDYAAALPAYADVNITSTTFDATTRELTVNVSGEISSKVEMDDIRLTLYLMEDSIKAFQAGANPSQIYHKHVMRDGMNRSVWGLKLNDRNINTTIKYKVPEKFKVNRCKVIAFVNHHSANVNDRKVLNADITARYIDAPYVGIDEVSSNVVMNVYPNPTTDFTTVEAESTIRTIRIVNTLGQEVYNDSAVNADKVTVNTSSFNAGMYVVMIKTDNGMAIRRISVVR